VVRPDGKTVYFADNRPGGLGGADIYVTRRVPKVAVDPARWPFDPPDGREYVWGEPENLGRQSIATRALSSLRSRAMA